jgi:hypothetical protein
MAAGAMPTTATRFMTATPTFTGITGATRPMPGAGTAVREDTTCRKDALAGKIAPAGKIARELAPVGLAGMAAAAATHEVIHRAGVPAWAVEDSVVEDSAAEDSTVVVADMAVAAAATNSRLI